MLKKYCNRCLLMCILCIVYISSAEAALIRLETTGIYKMGDKDTPVSAMARAKENAIKIAEEKAGIYIESYTKTNNFVVTKDEIVKFSSKCLSVVREEYMFDIVSSDTIVYKCYLVTEVDSDIIDQQKEKRKTENDRILTSNQEKIAKLTSDNYKLKAILKEMFDSSPITSTYYKNKAPKSSNDWCDRALVLGMSGYYNQAVECCNKALSLNPKNIKALNIQGVIYCILSDYVNGINKFDAAINIDNQNYEAYLNKSRALYFSGNYYEALDFINKAILVCPTEHSLYYHRYELAIITNDLNMALADINRCIYYNPYYSQYYLDRGKLNISSLERIEESIRDFSTAILKNKKNSEAYAGRSLANALINNMDASLKDFEYAIKYSENCKGSLTTNYKFISMAQKKYNKAIENLQIYIKNYPSDSRAEKMLKMLTLQ